MADESRVDMDPVEMAEHIARTLFHAMEKLNEAQERIESMRKDWVAIAFHLGKLRQVIAQQE